MANYDQLRYSFDNILKELDDICKGIDDLTENFPIDNNNNNINIVHTQKTAKKNNITSSKTISIGNHNTSNEESEREASASRAPLDAQIFHSETNLERDLFLSFDNNYSPSPNENINDESQQKDNLTIPIDNYVLFECENIENVNNGYVATPKPRVEIGTQNQVI